MDLRACVGVVFGLLCSWNGTNAMDNQFGDLSFGGKVSLRWNCNLGQLDHELVRLFDIFNVDRCFHGALCILVVRRNNFDRFCHAYFVFAGDKRFAVE